jgi:3-oxoadipate enol-lactonase
MTLLDKYLLQIYIEDVLIVEGAMPFATVNNLKMYYEIEGHGHPLILIGGYTSDLSSWDFVRSELAKHFQLLLFDNRGAGRTEVPNTKFTIDQMAEDTIALARHLDLKTPHILGHSMGGMIAQTMAYRFPESVGKAIFSSTSTKLPQTSVFLMDTTLELREQGLSSRMLSKVMMPWMLSNAFLANSALCEKFIERREQLKYFISLEGQKGQLEALRHFDSSSWYQKIKTPSLVICGDEDFTCPAKDSYLLEQGIDGAKIHVFKHLGHMVPLERVEELCTLVVNFLGMHDFAISK